MNLWQSRLNAVCREMDKVDLGIKVRYADEPVMALVPATQTYCVIKTFRDTTKQVAFGMTKMQAEMFVSQMPEKMFRVEGTADGSNYFEKAEFTVEEE